jgi:hypothetical protein
MKCIAYGWEISPKYHAIASESLQEATK